MSTWRTKALEQLPEYITLVENSEVPENMWLQLLFEFEVAVSEGTQDKQP